MRKGLLREALIIREQIGNKCLTMIGANSECVGREINNNPYYAFKIGKNPKKIRAIKIIYTPSDTYTMVFYKFAPKMEVVTLEDIYSEDLPNLIGQISGLDILL